MKVQFAVILPLIGSLVCLSAGRGQAQEGPADVVYINGHIYTVNEAQPFAEAVAIKDGRFMVVGSNADVAVVTGDGTEVIDGDTVDSGTATVEIEEDDAGFFSLDCGTWSKAS